MRLVITILLIRLHFVVGLVAFLATLPLYWTLGLVDEEGERFPRLADAVGRVEFWFKGLSLRCARAEHGARTREITKLERQIEKEFES